MNKSIGTTLFPIILLLLLLTAACSKGDIPAVHEKKQTVREEQVDTKTTASPKAPHNGDSTKVGN